MVFRNCLSGPPAETLCVNFLHKINELQSIADFPGGVALLLYAALFSVSAKTRRVVALRAVEHHAVFACMAPRRDYVAQIFRRMLS
jgi:hypothetical protein